MGRYHWVIRRSTSFQSYKMGTKNYICLKFCVHVHYMVVWHKYSGFLKFFENEEKNQNFQNKLIFEKEYFFWKTKILKTRDSSFIDLSFPYKITYKKLWNCLQTLALARNWRLHVFCWFLFEHYLSLTSVTPDLRWPKTWNFVEGVKLMPMKVLKSWRRCAPRLSCYLGKPQGGISPPHTQRDEGQPSPVCGFLQHLTCRGGPLDPPTVRPLMVLELGGKSERVARNERMPMVSNFMVLGQPVTSEVRSNTHI